MAENTTQEKESMHKLSKKVRDEQDVERAEKKALEDKLLREKMKEMERAKRDKLLAENKVRIQRAEPQEDGKIDFDSWWSPTAKRLSIKPWMKEIIKADFKGRGLSNREAPEKYEEGLSLFGIKTK